MGLAILRKSVLSLALLVLFVILAQPGKVSGAWPDDPEMNVPICMADGTQEHPRITTDGASGAIIVWQDISPTSSSDIYVQRIDARGQIRWTTNGVAICLEKDTQLLPNLIPDGESGAIIAWWDKRAGNMDIYAQRVNRNGEVQWQPGGVPVCAASGVQQDFDITPDGEGGAIITWHDYRAQSGAPDIYVQRINTQGKPQWKRDGIMISRQESYQRYPTIAGDGAGGAIIAWHDWRGENCDIHAQRVDANGQILWREHGIPICVMPEHQWYAAIASDGGGGAIIIWMDSRDKAGWDIYAQRVNPQGEPQWQINGAPVCLAQGDQYDYSIIGDGASGAFITWHDQRTGEWDIYAQKMNASGNAQWAKDGLPVCIEPSDQYNPNIVSDGVDGVIISWWDKRDFYADIYAQRIDASGKILWTDAGAAVCTADGRQQDPHPVNSGVGSAIIVWWDMRRIDADIYVQRIISE